MATLPGENERAQNGRVSFTKSYLSAGGDIAGVPGFETQTKTEVSFKNDMLRGNWEATPLSDGFFSRDNIELIQNGIRNGVYERSKPKGYVIDKQSVDELKIIMRAIFYQYARNLPDNVPQQIKDLNQKVLDWSVPHILSAVDHYYYYLDDVSHMPVPLAQSISMSSAGTRTLPMNPFL
jgi:hypothetical protein